MANYLDVPSGSYAEAPNIAAFNGGSGPLELIADMTPVSWASGSYQTIVGAVSQGGRVDRISIYLNPSGGLEFYWNTASSGTKVAFSTANVPFGAGVRGWVRMVLDIAAGTCDFYTSTNGSSWTALGTQNTGLSTDVLSSAGTGCRFRIGYDGTSSDNYIGKFHYVKYLANSVVLYEQDWGTATPGAGPWTGTDGLTWTAGASAVVVSGVTSITAAATQAQAAAVSLVKNALPLLQITEPAAPAADPSQVLGCGIARAEIFTRGGASRVMDLTNITGTDWGRSRSDTSMGMVELDGVAIAADPACCALLATIRPLKHELHIYRDDELAWCGPIIEIDLDGPKLTIRGRDLSFWLDRRFIHFPHSWGGQQSNQGSEESTTIFLAVTTDAILPDTSLVGPPPANPQIFNIVGANGAAPCDLLQRTYSPAQFKPCGPEIRDLAKGNLDWSVIKRVGYVNHSTWRKVDPNPVVNPTFEVNTVGWSGITRDTAVFHSGVASGRTGAPPNATGSIVGLEVGRNYQLRCYVRGTSSALDAAQKSNDDGVIKVGNDESNVFSWYVYNQSITPTGDNRGRTIWIQVGVMFTATATTMPITITATGSPIDSHGIYFDDFEVWQQAPSFTIRDSGLSEPTKVLLSGLDQVNRAIVANQQSGGDYAFYKEAPKPAWPLGSTLALTADQIEFGLLEGISTQALSDSSSAQSAASIKAATLGGTPLILDRIVLSPDAGVTMSDLVPGVLFTLRLDEPCFAVQSELILTSVSVKTTPSAGEQVTLGFDPTGF